MKLSFLAVAALAAISGSAVAQSSVNLFGVVDVNVRAVKNGEAKTYKSTSTDGLSSSRLGFRGVEDLGDGLKAIFWLEASVQPDAGTVSTKFWNRRSTVALSDPRFGEIRLGRDNTPLFTAYAVYDPFGTNGLGEILGNGTSVGILSTLGSGTGTISRSDNQVSYFLPGGLGGVYGQVAIAPSEGTVGNKYWSGRLGYAAGAIDVSAGYADTTVALDNKFKQVQVGASYDFKVAKLSGQYIQAKFDSTAGGDRKQKVIQVGVAVPIGVHTIRADYIRGDMSGGAVGSGFGDDDDASQFAIGYYYSLSKRTALYANAATLRNKGASRLVVAAATNVTMTRGDNSTGYDLGIRHSF